MAKRIDVDDVNVYYSDFLAVEGASINIAPLTVTAFIGPSGCGKSTFLRVLNRMHEVIPGGRVSGSVMLDGEDLYGPGVDPVNVRRTVGMVFQKANPFPTMSIYDNVIAGYKIAGTRKNKSETDDIVERSLQGREPVGRGQAAARTAPAPACPAGSSSGCASPGPSPCEPSVLLMDEPCSALDPISTLAIEDLISELKSSYTIVIVTHNMQQAARVSDRTAFFNLAGVGQPGKLVEYDDTTKIFSNPSEKATEDYISGRFG